MMDTIKKIHTIDASDRPLGRLASLVALLLRGKMDASFERYLSSKDVVRVFNMDKVKLTGNKREQKTYHHHSGYPGGLKTLFLKKMMVDDPGDVFMRAVYGMLPKNKLRAPAMKRLVVYRKEITH